MNGYVVKSSKRSLVYWLFVIHRCLKGLTLDYGDLLMKMLLLLLYHLKGRVSIVRYRYMYQDSQSRVIKYVCEYCLMIDNLIIK